jgi:hypothetical protein
MTPTFCAAAWSNAVLKTNGRSSICCANSESYEVPHLTESLQHPVRLAARETMLLGQPARGCESCYMTEANGSKSLRHEYNNMFENSLDRKRLNEPAYSPIMYYDLSLSNTCNQKCRMCGPDSSTHWIKDYAALQKEGIAPAQENQAHSQINSIDSIIDSMKRSLVIRLSLKGGEPLYMREVKILLRKMVENNLHRRTTFLQIITNGSVADQETLDLLRHFQICYITLSIDACGPLYNYIRGFNKPFEEVEESFRKIIEVLPRHVTPRINTTVQALNVLHLNDLEIWIRKFFNGPVDQYLSLLIYPNFLNISNLPLIVKETAIARLQPLGARANHIIARLNEEENPEHFRQFFPYTRALDARRDENLENVAPELAEMLSYKKTEK